MVLKYLTLALSLTLTPEITSMTTQQLSSAQILMSPVSGIPLTVTEIEEHSHKRDDDSVAVDYTVTAKQYRDSAGRVRIESKIMNPEGKKLRGLTVSITDPIAGFQAVLSNDAKTAYRLTIGKSFGNARLFFADAADGQDLPHQWKVAQEDAESQTIQGYSFKGSRIVTSAEDAPNLTTTFSQWYSDQLKLFGAIERSGPEKSYTVRIQQLEFGEPDHALFEIPADYRVVDIEMPQP
jgi:hypothetical protein